MKKFLKDNSPGIDGIPNSCLKKLLDDEPQILVDFVNAALAENTFTEALKCGLVKAVPKPLDMDGKEQTPRPITLLPTTGKLLERIVAARLKDEMYRKGIQLNGQFGSRHGVAANDALRSCLQIMKSIPGVTIFLDLSKAFDKMVHARLLFTMKEMGSVFTLDFLYTAT